MLHVNRNEYVVVRRSLKNTKKISVNLFLLALSPCLFYCNHIRRDDLRKINHPTLYSMSQKIMVKSSCEHNHTVKLT
jgi:hypothetical protein